MRTSGVWGDLRIGGAMSKGLHKTAGIVYTQRVDECAGRMVGEDAPVFERGEAKRQATLARNGIAFIDAIELFAGEHLILPARSEVEVRWMAVGFAGGFVMAVIYTMRGNARRLITARRARRHERENYRAFVHRGHPQA